MLTAERLGGHGIDPPEFTCHKNNFLDPPPMPKFRNWTTMASPNIHNHRTQEA